MGDYVTAPKLERTNRVLTIPMPLPSGNIAYLALPLDINREQWDLMMRVLDAMKPGLVTQESVSERASRNGC